MEPKRPAYSICDDENNEPLLIKYVLERLPSLKDFGFQTVIFGSLYFILAARPRMARELPQRTQAQGDGEST
ncbi:hypothetical protein BDW69DRAFT_185318 [Aspergillus filifer]